jgi:hypothetical protein
MIAGTARQIKGRIVSATKRRITSFLARSIPDARSAIFTNDTPRCGGCTSALPIPRNAVLPRR